MAFDTQGFMNSPLTSLGMGLLATPGDQPIGTGLLAGMQQYQKAQALRQQQEQEARLSKYQEALMANQMQDNARQLQAETMKQQWAQAISAGDFQSAMKIDPLNTQKFIKESAEKEQELSDYDRYIADPEGFRRFKLAGQLPSQAQPRQPTEFEQYQANPEAFAKFAQARKAADMVATVNEDGTVTTAKAGSKKPLTAVETKILSDGNSMADLLAPIEKLIKDRPYLFDPIKGKLAEYNPYDKEAASALAELSKVRQIVGSYMEGGVLRKEDEEKYKKMLPGLGDTVPVAKVKLKSLARTLAKKNNQYLSDYSKNNREVAEFAPTPEPSALYVLPSKWKGLKPGVHQDNAGNGIKVYADGTYEEM